jgi:glutamate/aspartate transport system substrate-binding protein
LLDGTLKKIKTSGVLTLGYHEVAMPVSFLGQNQQPSGYSVELCTRVANAIQAQLGLADLKVNWPPVSAENRIDMVVRGKLDLE